MGSLKCNRHCNIHHLPYNNLVVIVGLATRVPYIIKRRNMLGKLGWNPHFPPYEIPYREPILEYYIRSLIHEWDNAMLWYISMIYVCFTQGRDLHVWFNSFYHVFCTVTNLKYVKVSEIHALKLLNFRYFKYKHFGTAFFVIVFLFKQNLNKSNKNISFCHVFFNSFDVFFKTKC